MNAVDDKDKVIERIMQDIANYAKQLASANNINLDSSLDPIEIILTYRRTKNKTFSNKARQVVMSQELKDKMSFLAFVGKDGNTVDEQEGKHIFDLINRFVEKFQNGEDVTNHSSKGIFSDSEDIILNNWNLRHLHLSYVETAVDKAAMSGNRSAWLLFYILTGDEVDFVDVVNHPKGAEFTAYRFLEIIQRNGWMEKSGFKEMENIIPGSLETKITKDEDIYTLYKGHLNIGFDLNGKAYFSFGVSMAGFGLEDTFYLNRFRRMLRKMLDENKYIELISDNADGYMLIFEDKDGHRSQMECQL